MPKSLKDIVGSRAGRNVSKDELGILGDLKVNKKEDPAGNKDDVFNASKVPAEATLQKADPGMRHGYRTLKASGKAYEETVIEQKKKKSLPPEDDRNVNDKGYGYSAGAKGGNGSAVSEKTNEEAEQVDEVSSALLHRAFQKAKKNAGWLMPGDKGVGDKAWNRAKKFQKAGMAKQEKERAQKKTSQRNEDVELDEAKACNMTNEGTFCEMHGMKACPKTNISELSSDTLKSYKEKSLFAKDKSPRQSFNRLVGYARASRKIDAKKNNEDVEYIYEIGDTPGGKKVLGNYIKRSAQSATSAAYNAGTTKSAEPGAKAHLDKERKRKVGIGQAVARITREDVDYEGEMAKTQLKALSAKASALASMMSDNQQLEAWVQSKLTNAKHDIDAVHDYLTYGEPTKEDAPNDPLMTFPGMNVDTAFGRV